MVFGSQNLGEAVLDLRADDSKLTRDLKQAERKTDKAVGGMAVGLGKTLARGAAAGFAGYSATRLIGTGISAASDLEESLNKTRVLFGEAAAEMPGFGSSVAEALGLSRQAALEGAASIGAMLVPMGASQDEAAKMSSRMLTLAADLGSFHNADPTEMLDRLRAGLSGESEPLKRFGIVLSEARVQEEAFRMGIAEQGATLTDAQKVQARYSLAIRDAGKANGDFARTSDGLANETRILKAEATDLAASLGQALLPAASGSVSALRGVVGFLSDHQGSIAAAAKVVRDALALAWEHVKRAVQAAMPTLESIVETVRSVATTAGNLWDRFGKRILDVLRASFGVVADVVKGALRQVQETINLVLAVLRGDWGDAWDALVALARNALTTAAKVVRGILTDLGPALARLALSAALAIGQKLGEGVLNGLRSLLGLPAKLWTLVSGAIGSVAASALAGAAAIGRNVVQGIKDGIGGLLGHLKDWLEGKIRSWLSDLNPFSPVEHGGAIYIGGPIVTGAIKGIKEREPALRKALSSAVVGAVREAKSNLGDLAGGLGGMIGDVLGARRDAGLAALADSPEAQRLAAIEAQQATEQRVREEARLRDAITATADALAKGEATQEDLAAAHRDLADWQLEQEADRLRESLRLQEQAINDEADLRTGAAETQLAELTTAFNAGLVKQKDYLEAVQAILTEADVDYRAAGELLGAAFADGFKAQLAAITQQVTRLGDVPGVRGTASGPSVLDPFATRMDEWREREDALEAALKEAKDSRPDAGSPQKAWDAWRTRVHGATARLTAHRAARPKRLALGGILTSPTLGLLAEAGVPELALPLDGSRRSWGLLERAAAMMPNREGTTHTGPLVNVDVMQVRAPEDAQLVAARLGRYLATEGVHG
jgi:hypothetical protein